MDVVPANRTAAGLALAGLLAFALPLSAQDKGGDDKAGEKPDAAAAKAPADGPSPDMKAMMEAWEKAATPRAEHRQLAEHFAGKWTTRQTMWMDPAAPPMSETGTAETTAEFGGRHLRSEFRSQWMGQPFHGVALTSFDNVRGKYVAHWVDDMSTGQFMATGDYDPATKTYTFTGEMPDPMAPDTLTRVREVIRIVDADHHTMEWYETREGHPERRSMVIEYTRAK